jgi:hypothetical protein
MHPGGHLELPFLLRGLTGLIDVQVGVNTNPEAIGYSLLTEHGAVGFA